MTMVLKMLRIGWVVGSASIQRQCQTGTARECRSRWLRAPATNPQNDARIYGLLPVSVISEVRDKNL